MGAGGGAETHTFLFTDVEGSTRRWQDDPGAMRALLVAHDRVLQEAVEAHRGRVFKHTGDGICAVFASVGEAVSAAVQAQRNVPLPVRMAVHTGEAIEREHDFFGLTLSRCARLMDAGHGGQVLLSAASAAVMGSGIDVRDLGEHRLRDLGEPERIFQVLAPQLPDEFPALRTLDAVRHNLPILRSSFVGRELELIDVCERLRTGQLLTLTGTGGCGKTRLALEAAASLVDHFPQGVFFVDLAVLSDPDLVDQTVAGALGLHLVDPSVATLAEYLTGRRVLVVLDNCEHLLDACAELADGLLSRCPDLHVVATSREALGVDGEQVFRVPSLGLETDAVRLFMDRARAVGANLAGEDAVAEICRRLDGIPLAIELAAARTTHLAPAQILGRLSDRFRLLTGGRRRIQRQQTLSAAIDWSHDLLSENEQTLFRRLAVFRGSFSLEAVEDVCHPDAVDLLGSLVDKSLVNVQLEDEAPRYRLLETVRAYAEERLLASGEAAEVRSAHRDWLLAWLESIPPGQLVEFGGGDRLVPEADNLAAALEWSVEEERLDLVARIASRMTGYWWSYMRPTELASWWRVLEPAMSRLPAELRAQALLIGSMHEMVAGDFDKMEKLSAEAVASAAPGSWESAFGWMVQALIATYFEPERGRYCIEQGRKAAEAAHTPEIGRTTALMAANLLTGDAEHDARLGREIMDGAFSTLEGSWPGMTHIFNAILAALGDTEKAAQLAASVPVKSTIQGFGKVLCMAVIAIREGRLEAAADHLHTLAAIVREHAIPLGEPTCVTAFAALAAKAGDYETASRLLASVRTAAPFPFRTPADVLIYRQTVRAVRAGLDSETAARCRTEGAAIAVSEALDAELARQPAQPAAR